MQEGKQIKKNLPPIGMRIIKSSIGVLLCFIIDAVRVHKGMPFYSAIAALWCMQPYVGSSLKMAIQRTTGTMIGAVYGLLVILIELYLFPIHIHNQLAGQALSSAVIILVLYTTILFNKKNTSYFSCVVFLSITVTHITDDNPFLFVGMRVLDTMIGIMIGVLVNAARMPREKRNDVMFVSDLDHILMSANETLTSYSKIQLNRMIDRGAKFTVATGRTPASVIEPLRDIHIKLPLIVMDGAALFDLSRKEFIYTYIISRHMAGELITFIEERHFHYFLNVMVDDVLVIHYGNFHNEVEKDIYTKLKVSPYRNYVNMKYNMDDEVVYIMIIDEREKMEKLYMDLTRAGYTERLKILFYDSRDYQGYSYIKIYNRNATKKNMVQYLKNQLGVSEVMIFGDMPEECDVVLKDGDSNEMVKELERRYEPVKVAGRFRKGL